MLGYLTAQAAKAEGFTHHGKYYGIPVWIGDPGGEMLVATKFWWMDPLLTLAHQIEGICHALRGIEPSHMFLVGKEIS